MLFWQNDNVLQPDKLTPSHQNPAVLGMWLGSWTPMHPVSSHSAGSTGCSQPVSVFHKRKWARVVDDERSMLSLWVVSSVPGSRQLSFSLVIRWCLLSKNMGIIAFDHLISFLNFCDSVPFSSWKCAEGPSCSCPPPQRTFSNSHLYWQVRAIKGNLCLGHMTQL